MRSTYTLLLKLMLVTIAAPTKSNAADVPPDTLELAATSWCPYICDDKQEQGIIVDFLEILLNQMNIKLVVTIMPWSRAISEARAGKFQGLLTAVPEEAPDFLFVPAASGRYQMCFYVQPASDFVYSGRHSLGNKILGMIQDYGYGEPIDSMLNSPLPNENIYPIASSAPLKQLIGMLLRSRLDVFIADINVVAHHQLIFQESGTLRQAGCLPEVDFYTAISPRASFQPFWLDTLATLLQSEDAQAIYQQTKDRYVN